jgi:type II pantothenate kinase
MVVYSFDFGGSTVDVARWEDCRLVSIHSYERPEVPTGSLSAFLEAHPMNGAERFFVTGGKSHAFEDFIHGVPVVKVDEIQAIGRGGQALLHQHNHPNQPFTVPSLLNEKALIVSMGTGTCLVKVEAGNCTHLGGTGVGGGTFLALCHLLLHEKNPMRLVELFRKGDPTKVDVSVGEIVGHSIGRISQDHTASNLGKIGFRETIEFEPADLAAGILNLVAQTIGIAAVFAARSESLKTLVLTGKLTRIDPILTIVSQMAREQGFKVVVPEKAEAVAAIGAAWSALAWPRDIHSGLVIPTRHSSEIAPA